MKGTSRVGYNTKYYRTKYDERRNQFITGDYLRDGFTT